MINLRHFDDDISLTSAIKASQIISQSTSNVVYDVTEASGMVQNRAYNGLNQDASIALINGYDNSGNMIKDGTRTLTYDVYNRLIRVQKTGLDARYDYDVEGRLQKVNYNGTVTTYRYFGADRIAEYNAANVVQRRYVHGVGTDEAVVQFEGTGFADKRFFVQNYQGSVVAMANTAGTVSALYKYGAYGEPYDVNGVLNWSGPAFRYTGQTILEGAGLYHYKARIYDPLMGRFLQTDPIGSDDDINLYAYTGGDPINGFDPTGKNCVNSTSGTTNCVGSGYNITIPTAKGFQNTNTSSSDGHNYNTQAHSTYSAEITREWVQNNPTPGSSNAASPHGSKNDATPVIGGLNLGVSPVMSYTATNTVSGNTVVVNVTLEGHPLGNGVVIRDTVANSDGTSTINNYGEGNGFLQSPQSVAANHLNGVWENHTPPPPPPPSTPSPYCVAKIGLGC